MFGENEAEVKRVKEVRDYIKSGQMQRVNGSITQAPGAWWG